MIDNISSLNNNDSSTIVFTGFRPTGDLHIGHYFSFIKPILNILHNTDHHIFIMVADLHSLTELRKIGGVSIDERMSYEDFSDMILNHTIDNVKTILKFIPNKYKDRFVIFRQSDNHSFHLNLFFKLLMLSKNSMTISNPVFKDTMKNEILKIIEEFNLDSYDTNIFNAVLDDNQHFLLGNIDPSDSTLFSEMSLSEDTIKYIIKKINSRSGILGMASYPILMATDIILYKPEVVPVGHDQAPHLQITNDLIRTINNTFDMSIDTITPLIMSDKTLKGSDGCKMSKTLNNYISINDLIIRTNLGDVDKKERSKKENTSLKWFKSMMTYPRKLIDSGVPEMCPVGSWYITLGIGEDVLDLCRDASIGCVACKNSLYEYIESMINNDVVVDDIDDDRVVEVILEGYIRSKERMFENQEVMKLID